MPIYAFRCESCGHSFDRLQKLSDPDPVECPECGKQAIKRQVTAPAFRLAGSGWYETDFKSGNDKKRNLAGAEPPKKQEEGGSKPEAAASKPAEGGASKAAPSASAASTPGGTAAG